MNLEPSTLDVLLAAIIAMQGWIVKELIAVKSKLALIVAHCPKCKKIDL